MCVRLDESHPPYTAQPSQYAWLMDKPTSNDCKSDLQFASGVELREFGTRPNGLGKADLVDTVVILKDSILRGGRLLFWYVLFVYSSRKLSSRDHKLAMVCFLRAPYSTIKAALHYTSLIPFAPDATSDQVAAVLLQHPPFFAPDCPIAILPRLSLPRQGWQPVELCKLCNSSPYPREPEHSYTLGISFQASSCTCRKDRIRSGRT
jgi:hypothetical protein